MGDSQESLSQRISVGIILVDYTNLRRDNSRDDISRDINVSRDNISTTLSRDNIILRVGRLGTPD